MKISGSPAYIIPKKVEDTLVISTDFHFNNIIYTILVLVYILLYYNIYITLF